MNISSSDKLLEKIVTFSKNFQFIFVTPNWKLENTNYTSPQVSHQIQGGSFWVKFRSSYFSHQVGNTMACYTVFCLEKNAASEMRQVCLVYYVSWLLHQKKSFQFGSCFQRKKTRKTIKNCRKNRHYRICRDNYQIVKIVSYAEEIRDAASIQKANGRPRKMH